MNSVDSSSQMVVGSGGLQPSPVVPSAPVAISGRNINELVRPRWSHLEYRWKLDNFWELRALACVEALEDENGGLIWSQRFGDKQRGFWQLKLYPYGDLSPAGRGHVSLFLSLDLKSLDVPKAYAIFGCYLLDEEGQKVANSGRSFTRQKFAEGSSSWGWSQFVKVEGASLNRLLTGPSDSLIIKCEIEVFVGVSTSPGRDLPQPKSWEEEVHEYLSNPANFDVSIVCEGRVTRGNRHVLCARSRWFERQLSGAGSAFVTEVSKRETQSVNDPFVTRDSTSTHQQSLAYASFGGIDSLATTSASTAAVPASKTTDLVSTSDRPTTESVENLRSALVSQSSGGIEITVDLCSADVLDNLVGFIHTDDCRFLAENAGLTEMLSLYIAAHKLGVDSLYATVTRKLCASIVSKSTAIAVQEVARELGNRELVEHCHSYLLMCVRELTDEELLKTLVPKSR